MPTAAPALSPVAHRPHAPLLRLRGGGSAPSTRGGRPSSRRRAGRALAGAERTESAIAGAAVAQGAERRQTGGLPSPPRSTAAEEERAERAQGQQTEVCLETGGCLATSVKESAGRELAEQDRANRLQLTEAVAHAVEPPWGKAALPKRSPLTPIVADCERADRLKVLPSAAVDRETLSTYGEAAHAIASGHEEGAHTSKVASVRSNAAALRDSAAIGLGAKRDGSQPQDDSILRVLSSFDVPLLKVLEAGTFRILSSEWLTRQFDGCRIERMQDLEYFEKNGGQPFLEPKVAADIVRQRRRALGVLSYPWLSAEHPDPGGDRMRAVRRALELHPEITGLFWEYASLPQSPRTDDEDKVFFLGLRHITDLYASPVGTTVLRSTFIPECPSKLQGVICLKYTYRGEEEVRLAVQNCIPQHNVKRIEVMSKDTVHVYLDSSPSQADTDSLIQCLKNKVCDHAFAAYDARPYEDRGWCFFESVVSSELLGRLNPKVQAAISSLPSKVIEVEADGRTKAVVDGLTGHFEAEIARKTFTGKGEAAFVTRLYHEYSERLAKRVTSTLHLSVEEEHGVLPPLPALPELPSPSVRLKRGQYVLFREASASQPAVGTSEPLPHLVPRLHRVADDAGDVCRLGIHGGSTAADINRLDHRALPWLRSAQRHGHTPVSESTLKWLVDALDATANRMAGVAVEAGDGHSTTAHATELPPALDEPRGELLVINAMCAAAVALAELNRLADMLKHLEETKPGGRGAQEHMNAERRIHWKIIELERQKVMADFTVLIRNARGRTMALATPTLDLGIERPTASGLDDARAAMVEAMAIAFQILGRAGREAIADVFQIMGEAGRRQYATQQRLLVRVDDEWAEAEVIGHEALVHLVRMEDKPPRPVLLDPWNHAPLEVPLATFDMLRAWWREFLASQHSSIVDDISGQRLDVLSQCVDVTIDGVDAGSTQGADGVHQWILREHARLCDAMCDALEPACLLITAGPAAGKTTLTSQLVMLLVHGPLVPILVRGQKWQRSLAERREVFAAAWNWVDAYVQVEYERQPAVVGMLRQAMRSRRAVLLLDGLDECGSTRRLFEAHIGGVLLPQGHVLVALSRPAGLGEASLRAFRRSSLLPLTEAQQQYVLMHRIPDAAERAKLWSYIGERLPRDAEGERITSNPLMLSMLASIAELHIGREMPRSIAEMYEVATDAMLARAKVQTIGSSEGKAPLGVLLRRLFSAAHLAQSRIINSELIRTIVGADAPWFEEMIRQDHVPLLIVQQMEPLVAHALHSSFQEYMVALDIADGMQPPGDLSIKGWEGVIQFGSQLGRSFCRNLTARQEGKLTNDLMFMAASCGYDDFILHLIHDVGADVRALNEHGLTALQLAVKNEHTSIVDILIDALGGSVDWVSMDKLYRIADNCEHIKLRLNLPEERSYVMADLDGLLKRVAKETAQEKAYEQIAMTLIGLGARLEEPDPEGNTPLLIAAAAGQTDITRVLCDYNANVNARNQDGESALAIASKKGLHDVVRTLIHEGADVNEVGIQGMTCLMWAAEQGHKDVVDVLLSKVHVEAKDGEPPPLQSSRQRDSREVADPQNINASDARGRTALMIASSEGHENIVEELIKRKANIEAMDERFWWTALMYASDRGHIPCVNLLIEKGASRDASAKDNRTALMIAAANGHKECVDRLLRSAPGELPTSVSSVGIDGNGWTALMHAASKGQTDCIRVLAIDGHAELEKLERPQQIAHMLAFVTSRTKPVDMSSKNGKTALMLSSAGGHVDCVNALIECHADVNSRASCGWTALMFACNGGHETCVDALLKANAHCKAKSRSRMTALMIASQGSRNPECHGHASCINKLVDSKAELGVADENGFTALIHASKSGQESCLTALMNNIPKTARRSDWLETKDALGWTALVHALLENEDEACAKLLLHGGAVLSATDKAGKNAFMLAAERGVLTPIDFLMRWEVKGRAVDLNTLDQNGTTALMLACKDGHDEVVDRLIQLSADVTLADPSGMTALMHACRAGHDAVLTKLLCTEGGKASVDKCEYGRSPLMLASEEGHYACVKVLLEHADLNLHNAHGYTALMLASWKSRVECLKLLLDENADCDKRTTDGWTAVMLACYEGHAQCVEILIDKGANLNGGLCCGGTALCIAQQQCRKACERALTKNGARRCDQMGESSTERADHEEHETFKPQHISARGMLSGFGHHKEATDAANKDKFVAKTLVLGHAKVAARGLAATLGIDGNDLPGLLNKREEAIVAEFRENGRREDKENLVYILHGIACKELIPDHVHTQIRERKYHGGSLAAEDFDRGHEGWCFEDFVNHDNCRKAHLGRAHVLALRLYTSSSYTCFNNALRERKRPHPFKMSVYYLSEALKQLRAVAADEENFYTSLALWRGMKNMTLDPQFEVKGGTELAPMSTSKDYGVACKYSASAFPLVFKFDAVALGQGVSIGFLSLFPKEEEYLYPPGTYLKYLKQGEEQLTVDGMEQTFNVIHVMPQMP